MDNDASPPFPRLGRRGEGWVAAQFGLIGAVAVTSWLGPPWSVWSPGSAVWRYPLAVTLGLGAAALGGPALAHLGNSLTPYPRPRENGTLVAHGVYRHVRHPMYGAVLLGSTALALIGSPLALVPAGVLALELEAKRRVEEHWLEDHYEGYRAYRARTRWRMVPGLW